MFWKDKVHRIDSILGMKEGGESKKMSDLWLGQFGG